MEELMPWERLADRGVLLAGAHETVEGLRRRLVERVQDAQHNVPILIRLANGGVAPTSSAALRTLAQRRGATVLRQRLASLLPELCPEPWATEGEAAALALARRRGLPVIATGAGVPRALAMPPVRQSPATAADRELFDLFDEPLSRADVGGAPFVVATAESTVAEVSAALGQGPGRDLTFVLLQAGSSFQVVDRRLASEAGDFAVETWPRTLGQLRPWLQPAEVRPYREVGIRQAQAIAERRFLVLLDEQGQPAVLVPPPPRLARQVLPGDAGHDLFDHPLALDEAHLEQMALPDAPFVPATADSPLAHIAAGLKQLSGDEARRAYVLEEGPDGSYAVVGTRELNDSLSTAGPEPWGRSLREVAPHPRAAQARAVETVGSRQLRLWAQSREPLVLLRHGRPWRLLPGATQPALGLGGAVDLFGVPEEVLAAYLAAAPGPGGPAAEGSPPGPERSAASGSDRPAAPGLRAVSFWFASPEGQALAHRLPLKLGRPCRLHVSIGPSRAETPATAAGSGVLEPAAEVAEGTVLHVCLFSDDFDIPAPTRCLVLPARGESTLAVFDLTPARAGRGEGDPATIDVGVYHCCNLVQAWQVRAEVVRTGQGARSSEPQGAVLLAARDPGGGLTAGPGRRCLSLFVDHAPGGYRLALALPRRGREGEVLGAWRAYLRREEMAQLVARARRQLTAIARAAPYLAAGVVDAPSRTTDLQALALAGRQLYLGLFASGGHGPAGAPADALRAEADAGGIVQVVHRARDLVIPWGLVYDRPLWDEGGECLEVALDGFWGTRYEIELLTEELLQVPATAGLEMGRQGPLRVGVGLGERPAAAGKQRQLCHVLAAEGGEGVEHTVFESGPAWLRLLNEGRHELLYLLCPGFTERLAADLDRSDDLLAETRALLGSLPPQGRAGLHEQEEGLFDVSDSWLQLAGGRVWLTMLRDCAPPRLEAAPLVLLNLCDSAQVVPSLSGGLIPFFLERGARGVIAAGCPLGSAFAHTFACEFLARFLRGEPAGRILWELRRRFLEMGNPLGLAYTLYGDAGTRLAAPGSLPRTEKEKTMPDEALERQIENLWSETEEDLYEVLGITEEAIGRAIAEGDAEGLAAARQYDAAFDVADTALAGAKGIVPADFFRDLGRTWWAKFEPKLHDLLCNKKNADHDDLMQALVHGAKDLALLLAPTLVARLDALPAAAVVLATIAAKKIAESGLEAACQTWDEAIADRQKAEPAEA